MKKVLALVLALIMVFSLVSCGTKETSKTEKEETVVAEKEETVVEEKAEAESTEPAEKAEEKVWRIGVTTQSWEHEFLKNMVNALKAIDAEMDNVELILYDSEDSIEKQLADVDNMIIDEVDGVLLNCLSFEGCSSAVEACTAAGIPVVEFISYTENEDYKTFVGTDVKSSGIMAGEFIANMLEEKGNVFEIQGIIGHTAQINRGAGIAEALGQYPDITIVESQCGEFSKETAMSITESWLLQYAAGEIDAIVAHNDQMALGAMNACIAAGRPEIKIVGIDGDLEALTAIQEGTMAATMVDYCEYECELAVAEMVSILEGNEPKGTIYADYVCVSTPDEAAEWIAKRS